MYKNPPLKSGKNADMQPRNKLNADLYKFGKFKIFSRIEGDVRCISTSIPRDVLGCVIHRRLYEGHDQLSSCLECTLLGENGDALELFTKYLFSVDCVGAFVVKHKSKVIICELEEATCEGMESVGFPMLRQRMSQGQAGLSQISQGYDSTQLSQQAVIHQMAYGQWSQAHGLVTTNDIEETNDIQENE